MGARKWYPDSEDTESEGTETAILGIGSSELHNKFFSAVMMTYAILLQLLQQKFRSSELESHSEEPWLRNYKGNKIFLIDELLYHREKNKSSLIVIGRDLRSLILQECQQCPYMGQISEYRTRERVASTAWWPK
ncbi:hypothetical protein O181_115867 [Austropuccinia psidii MF-1]|uniref:Uncharacterized protein n=1 Tax=Austropuccinia psidii MF-1 TaxID=1389203 RepID=A0A9Q3KAB9_9BASI|nr:hypothetical protein [Austropuccinia psidii MF-1]